MHVFRSTARPGMTIIEVLFAIVILSGVMLSLARFGQSFTRASNDAANLAEGSDLAAGRIEAIKEHRVYSTIVSTFNGTTETSADANARPSMTGRDGFTRRTAVVRTNDGTADYLTATVTVTANALQRPVTKTVLIAAFR